MIKRQNLLVAIIVGLLFQFLAVAILLSRFESEEPGAFFVALLFAIPPLLQVLGMFLVKRMQVRVFYSFIALLSSGSYLCCWIYYVKKPAVSYHVAWICLALTGIFAVIAFLITTAIFRDNNVFYTKASFTHRLANGIGTSPAGELLFFLAFFISIGYLISFSLAFSDRYRTRNRLLPGLRSDVSFDYDNNRPPQSESSTQITPEKKWFIQFHTGSATLELEKTPPLKEETSINGIQEYNTHVLYDIISTVRRLENNQLVRITLIGHSDDVPLFRNNRYTSNYELAEARANAVRLALLKLLTEHTDKGGRNIEWLVVPLSESTSESEEAKEQNRRSVEVSIQPLESQVEPNSVATRDGKQIRLLTLIEYVYFSMYTITTTGYGDIKPATPFVMFVCTLANLYEIFFLVIFFNVLLSPKARALSKRKNVANSTKQSSTTDIDQVESDSTEENLHPQNSASLNTNRSKKSTVLILCSLFIVYLFKRRRN